MRAERPWTWADDYGPDTCQVGRQARAGSALLGGGAPGWPQRSRVAARVRPMTALELLVVSYEAKQGRVGSRSVLCSFDHRCTSSWLVNSHRVDARTNVLQSKSSTLTPAPVSFPRRNDGAGRSSHEGIR